METSAGIQSIGEIATIVTQTSVRASEGQPAFEAVYSPTQTRLHTRQLGMLSLLTHDRTRMFFTTPQYAYVPIGVPVQSTKLEPTLTTSTA